MTPSLSNSRITVMGLGRFGGGVGVVRYLCAQGKQVVVTDLEPAERLAESLAQIQDLVDAGQVTLRLGNHDERDFVETDLVIANPAVPMPWDNPYLQAAERAGIPITTEIRLLVERLPRRDHVIGVTGTAGKSTTSAMIAHALRVLIAEAGEQSKVWLGGNIGGSLLNDVGTIGADDLVVLELSSAQLYWLSQREEEGGKERQARRLSHGEQERRAGRPPHQEVAPWSPGVAVVTNISPNHLDWHGSFEHYAACKRAILGGTGIAIVGKSESGWPGLLANREGIDVRSCKPGLTSKPGHPMNLRVPGEHNRINAQFAIEAIAAMGFARSAAAMSLESFPGLPHRLQLVHDIDGLRAYNDSKCTTPEATALAIAAFDESGACGAEKVRLICGGYDKKIDLAPMIAPAATCAAVYTIGATGPTIDALVRTAGGTVQSCKTLEVAVECAAKDAQPGDVILLSPGCASWDQFTNYEERGELFAQLAGGQLNMQAIHRKTGLA